jgi:hypothetical protein
MQFNTYTNKTLEIKKVIKKNPDIPFVFSKHDIEMIYELLSQFMSNMTPFLLCSLLQSYYIDTPINLFFRLSKRKNIHEILFTHVTYIGKSPVQGNKTKMMKTYSCLSI